MSIQKILFIGVFISAQAFSAVRVYCSESFVGEGSLGEFLKSEAKKSNIDLSFISFGSAGEAVNQLKIEGAATKADLVIGLDEGLLERVAEANVLTSLPKKFSVPGELSKLALHGTAAYDYGYLAFVYDSAKTHPPAAKNLEEFVKVLEKKKVLALEDPRTSSIGQSFLLWTASEIATDKWGAFWKRLEGLTVSFSSGWTGAYSLFSKGEASYVMSYTTSPAYHRKSNPQSTERAVSFEHGHYLQVETVGLSKYSQNQSEAIRVVEILLGDAVQKEVPIRNFMLPVRKVSLPNYYSVVPDVKKTIGPPNRNLKELLREWKKQVI